MRCIDSPMTPGTRCSSGWRSRPPESSSSSAPPILPRFDQRSSRDYSDSISAPSRRSRSLRSSWTSSRARVATRSPTRSHCSPDSPMGGCATPNRCLISSSRQALIRCARRTLKNSSASLALKTLRASQAPPLMRTRRSDLASSPTLNCADEIRASSRSASPT